MTAVRVLDGGRIEVAEAEGPTAWLSADQAEEAAARLARRIRIAEADGRGERTCCTLPCLAEPVFGGDRSGEFVYAGPTDCLRQFAIALLQAAGAVRAQERAAGHAAADAAAVERAAERQRRRGQLGPLHPAIPAGGL